MTILNEYDREVVEVAVTDTLRSFIGTCAVRRIMVHALSVPPMPGIPALRSGAFRLRPSATDAPSYPDTLGRGPG